MKIAKDTAVLFDSHYNHPNTSLLLFRFEPEVFSSSEARLKGARIQRASIAGKDLYLLDGFFSLPEQEELRSFSLHAPFSKNSYGSKDAIERGEKPAFSMNGKERWQFFSKPLSAIAEVYRLFSTLGKKLNAELTTLPWELFDPSSVGSPALIANKLERASEESMDWGKHQDSNPAKNIPFGIPVLYSEEQAFHPEQFTNGDLGRPWLVSVMVYCTADNFLPHYRMGTVFYDENQKIAFRANCLDMRLVFFEGDLFHSIEASEIPSDVNTWRISYVFKMIVNPKAKTANLKQAFFDLMSRYSPIENLSLGLDARG